MSVQSVVTWRGGFAVLLREAQERWASSSSPSAMILMRCGALNPDLDIWAAYATVHLLMPDGSMRMGGEAVAEVLRRIPATQWLSRSFSLRIFGFRPFQLLLNLSYTILADVRPLFGCESCGMPSIWLRPFVWVIATIGAIFGRRPKYIASMHFSANDRRQTSSIGNAPK